MNPLDITREELSWALGAVIPHAGSANRDLDWIGLEVDPFLNQLFVFATDSYTVGIAKADCDAYGVEHETVYLTPKEARDLAAFVRPARVAEKLQTVRTLTVNVGSADPDNPWELHVGVGEEREGQFTVAGTESEPLSGVWSVRVPGQTFQSVYGLVQNVWQKSALSDVAVFNPKLPAKFSRAQREDEDVLNIYPAWDGDKAAAVVTVGSGFIGAASGIASSRYVNQLAQWGLLTEEQAA